MPFSVDRDVRQSREKNYFHLLSLMFFFNLSVSRKRAGCTRNSAFSKTRKETKST